MGKSKENIYVARKGLWELKICCFSTKNGTAGYERGWDEDREMLLKNLKFFYGKSRSSVALREKGADGREDLWNGILSWISFKFKTVPIIRSQREWIPGKFNGFLSFIRVRFRSRVASWGQFRLLPRQHGIFIRYPLDIQDIPG